MSGGNAATFLPGIHQMNARRCDVGADKLFIAHCSQVCCNARPRISLLWKYFLQIVSTIVEYQDIYPIACPLYPGRSQGPVEFLFRYLSRSELIAVITTKIVMF